MNSLVDAADSIGISLDDQQVEQFLRYRELITEWNRRANLTAVTDPDEIVERLFIQSLRVAVPAGGNVSTAGWFEGRSVIDIGSGAGIPGIPLKLALPGAEVVLLESNRKKCEFMEHVVTELGLDGVTILNSRAEDAARDTAHREGYDMVTARAVASLSVLAEYSIGFLKLGGVAVFPKGPVLEKVSAESDDAALIADEMGAAPAIMQAVAHPGNAPTDHIIYWLKIRPTPDRFPRRAGIPAKRPITAERAVA